MILSKVCIISLFKGNCNNMIVLDCDSGEDEKGCSDIGNKNNNRECTDEEYTCKDGRCIFKSWVCDSIEDCMFLYRI